MKIYVYRVVNGLYYDMNAELVKEGVIVFDTDHFSEYLVTTEHRGAVNDNPESDGSGSSDSENSSDSADSDSGSAGRPDTGFTGFAMLGVAALAGAAVIANRKRK